MPNALIHETSPYLLQHAHNPVNWFPWGEEALKKAKEEDKPILVSIGYSACHWCHVMEKESFEDEATATIMNEYFINIKIDREERPDLDQIYMDAVQAMTGSGGWPLNVFLTPNKKPFYGGTYFPPKAMMNRPSWKDVLIAVADGFKSKRKEIEAQSDNLTQHLSQSNKFGIHTPSSTFALDDMDNAFENIMKQADTLWGGFGNAPKFPQTFSIQFLLHYNLLEKKRKNDDAEAALKQALLSIDKMIDGGMYDQIGGGFARYSTDREWLAPHFEKMLYDNALLITTISEAYRITKNEKYKTIIAETVDFLQRELMHQQGGFYSALDADSEGVEGKCYIWTLGEITKILGDDAELFSSYYDVSEKGNWVHDFGNAEGINILRVLKPLELFATERNISISEVSEKLNKSKTKLFAERQKRIRPGLDDKILLGWNALMNTALCKAFCATGNSIYKKMAIDNMNFILSAFADKGDELFHVWKNNKAKHPAYLDDYAWLIEALLNLYQISANTVYLKKAKALCFVVIENFLDEEGYFFYTPKNQKDIIIRKKEIYDGATPSGNAVMAQNLLKLGIIFENSYYTQLAEKMIIGVGNMATKYPTSFGVWLDALFQLIKGTKEIVIIGEYEKPLEEVNALPVPFSILMASKNSEDGFPLLKDKLFTPPFSIFLCQNYACQKPVQSVLELSNLINN